MGTSPLLLVILLSLLPLFLSSNIHLRKLKFNISQLPHSNFDSNSGSPSTFFEVTRPIPLPETSSCSILLLQHDFAYTYCEPPVTVHYTPPSCLNQDLSHPPRIVLEWNATCKGRQFDRIFGVWLGGVELLRSCTAEPSSTGIIWSVRKDITKYSSLFFSNSTLAVYLGNIVDSTYTGIYHVNLSVHFYFDSSQRYQQKHGIPAFNVPADLVLPISRHLPLDDGLWFLIQNSTDIQSKDLVIPSNTYRAQLEVYVSFHSDDESWYANPPNVYISENNLTDTPGNGAFREVTISLDGDVVGTIWPFTVIYTGGVNPLLWRPITGIGSFNLPSYNIEITPFLGKLLDKNPHKFGFGVTNALDVWFVDANLHLWLDHKSSKTIGGLIDYNAPHFSPTSLSKFKGLDGKFKTNANRRISSSGWVESSYGNITTNFSQELHYKNFMKFSNNGTDQLVLQTIQSTYKFYAESLHDVVYTEQMNQTFPLYLYTGMSDKVKDSYSLITNVSLGFDQKEINGDELGLLTNLQNGHGYMKVKGNLVKSGFGSTQQVYKYEGTDGCYFRNVSSSNYTISFDVSEDSCIKTRRPSFLNRWVPRTTLAEHEFETKEYEK